MVVGFDVSKQRANWSLVNKSGKRLQEGKCANTVPAISLALASLPRRKYLQAVVESTGTCHRATVTACREQQVPCRLVNPIQTKQFTHATVRNTKTDRQDAYYLALLGLQGAGHIVQRVEPDQEAAQIYLRLASRVQVIHGTCERLRQYLEATNLPLNTELLVTAQGQLSQTVTAYRQLAAGLLTTSPAVGLLQTIPGLGPVLAMGIVTEIGVVQRFHDASQLVAYAGLDPRIKQSGMSSSTGRLTKRGSPYLRHWLFLAANGAKRCDPELHAAYWRQRNRGKTHTVATVYIARRLIHRIYAVLKRGTAYEIRAVEDSTSTN